MLLRMLLLLLLTSGPVGAGTAAFCEPTPEQAATMAVGEIRVELHELPGSYAKEGCAFGLMPAPPEVVYAIVYDAARFPEFMPHTRSSEVEPLADGGYLNRQHLSLPFPIRDRHYTIRISTTTPADTAGAAERWRIAWTYVAGSGNVVQNEGAWILLRAGPGSTLVAYRVLSDPGGLIPKWAVNRATRKTLPDVLRAVAARVEELDQASAERRSRVRP